MIIRIPILEKIASLPEQYPEDDLPEIAFAGRSNVGKSSLINRLMERKALARTSSKPGKTRTINFYRVNDDCRLVDLPGYGFAHVSMTERNAWAKMIEAYLHTRKSLRQVVLLVDIRHEPTKLDCQMYDWILHAGYSGVVVATKADKISKGQIQKHIKVIKDTLNLKETGGLVIPFSSTNSENGKEIWKALEQYL
ncbi:MAG: YihA family ribosome biogenesis GTP-binding protein [Tissierellia bacterium]|nr:YihA family ribosome biogenesis GTP-binding protein [Tissierellia bacterium]